MSGDTNTTLIDDVKESSIITFLKKIKRKTIIDILIVLIPLLLIYFHFVGNETPPEVKQVLKDNQKIDKRVDSLMADNQFIMQRMFELQQDQILFRDMISRNNDLISENNKELSRLKRIYNEKINSINNFNVSQLDSFFTNRYRDYYNR